MMDREMVIQHFQDAVEAYGKNTTWRFVRLDIIEKAISLLKAQEPRVLTLEEVLGGDECWFEYINGSFGYADVVMQDNTTALIYRTIVSTGEVMISDYGKKWRCWSYGPTTEQRKAVKWDD